jgi:general secretion pathway protein D
MIRDTIIKLDTVPRQVVIEGIIAAVDLKDNLSLGLAYSIKTNISNLNATIGLNTSSLGPASTNSAATVGSAGFSLIGIDSAGSVRALITALASDSKAKLLAAPHILVSDNREARIQVGQQVPIITSETYGTPGVAPQKNIQYRDIGIILKAKPRVNEGGLVTLELAQEISTYSTINLGVGDTEIIINKTEATTNLVVQDGQTIVIGGLIREDKTTSRSGIPFLSRIPLIGWLFGNTDDNIARTEIIILLTPRVIKNQKEAGDVTSGYVDQITQSGGIKREELLKTPGEKPRTVNDLKSPVK